jgi:hypothetical protein
VKPYIPVPVKPTACGLPPPSSLNSTDALRAPVAVGVKVTFTEQLSPTPKVLPHVVVSEKSPAFVPAIAISQMCIVALPSFLSVTVMGVLLVPTDWLLKLRLVGVRLTPVPTPVRITVWGLPPALSLMLIEALRGPGPVGLKVTLN